jgi:hypothetical protein
MIKIFGGYGGRILADLVTGKIIKWVRWIIRVTLGTGPQAVTDE